MNGIFQILAAYAIPNLSSFILLGSMSTSCSFTDSVVVAMFESQRLPTEFAVVVLGGEDKYASTLIEA